MKYVTEYIYKNMHKCICKKTYIARMASVHPSLQRPVGAAAVVEGRAGLGAVGGGRAGLGAVGGGLEGLDWTEVEVWGPWRALDHSLLPNHGPPADGRSCCPFG